MVTACTGRNRPIDVGWLRIDPPEGDTTDDEGHADEPQRCAARQAEAAREGAEPEPLVDDDREERCELRADPQTDDKEQDREQPTHGLVDPAGAVEMAVHRLVDQRPVRDGGEHEHRDQPPRPRPAGDERRRGHEADHGRAGEIDPTRG